jgi:thioredoxin 1
MANAKIEQLSEASFDASVIKSGVPVLVDFWAEWCGPCKMIAPLLDEMADEYDGKLKIGKVNVDDNQALAGKFGIRAIPTLLLFKDGQVKEQIVGMTSKKDLQKKLQAHVS